MEHVDCTMKNFEFDIVSLGILVFDVFGKTIDEFPKKGTSIFFDTMQAHPGGCAYNTGVDAARLGLKVAVLGKLGMDMFGEIIVQSLQKEGVNIRGIKRTDVTNTAFSFVMVPNDSQRRIYTSYGTNSCYEYSNVDMDLILKSRILHIAGTSLLTALDGEPTVELLKFAQINGILTCMDPVVKQNIGNLIIPCLKYLDIFIPNSDESYYITGFDEPEKQLRFYMEAGVKLAGIKMGSEGCLISDGKNIYKFGIYDVPVIDTCGAGDAFVSGFLFGVVNGWDIATTSKFATATSSFCVRTMGATTSIPDASKVLEFMKNKVLLHEVYSY